MLSTLGMPTRNFERSLTLTAPLVAAEPFLPNHVCNVWKGILRLLDSGLDDLHFVQVFDQSLWTGVVHDDPFPTFVQRNLTPGAPLAVEQSYINKTALAIDRTPVTDGIGGSRGFVGEFLNGVESTKDRPPAVLPPVESNQGCANRASFPGVRMNHHLGIGDLAENKVHLCLHDCQIAVCSALQDVLLSDLLQIVHAAGVDPDVERQDCAQSGENFFRLPSLALLVDDVALQEDAAPHRQLWHCLGLKGAVRHVAHRDVEALSYALQERAVARGALRV